MTIAEAQQQAISAQSQAEASLASARQSEAQTTNALQKLNAYNQSLPNIESQKFLRAVSYKNPLQAMAQRQKVEQVKGIVSSDINEAKSQLNNIQSYKNELESYQKDIIQFNENLGDYLSTDAGKLQFAKENNIEGRPVYDRVVKGGVLQVVGYEYNTPQGKVTDYSRKNEIVRQLQKLDSNQQEQFSQEVIDAGFSNANDYLNSLLIKQNLSPDTTSTNLITKTYGAIPVNLREITTNIPQLSPPKSGGVESKQNFNQNFGESNKVLNDLKGFADSIIPSVSAQPAPQNLISITGVVQPAPQKNVEQQLSQLGSNIVYKITRGQYTPSEVLRIATGTLRSEGYGVPNPETNLNTGQAFKDIATLAPRFVLDFALPSVDYGIKGLYNIGKEGTTYLLNKVPSFQGVDINQKENTYQIPNSNFDISNSNQPQPLPFYGFSAGGLPITNPYGVQQRITKIFEPQRIAEGVGVGIVGGTLLASGELIPSVVSNILNLGYVYEGTKAFADSESSLGNKAIGGVTALAGLFGTIPINKIFKSSNSIVDDFEEARAVANEKLSNEAKVRNDISKKRLRLNLQSKDNAKSPFNIETLGKGEQVKISEREANSIKDFLSGFGISSGVVDSASLENSALSVTKYKVNLPEELDLIGGSLGDLRSVKKLPSLTLSPDIGNGEANIATLSIGSSNKEIGKELLVSFQVSNEGKILKKSLELQVATTNPETGITKIQPFSLGRKSVQQIKNEVGTFNLYKEKPIRIGEPFYTKTASRVIKSTNEDSDEFIILTKTEERQLEPFNKPSSGGSPQDIYEEIFSKINPETQENFLKGKGIGDTLSLTRLKPIGNELSLDIDIKMNDNIVVGKAIQGISQYSTLESIGKIISSKENNIERLLINQGKESKIMKNFPIDGEAINNFETAQKILETEQQKSLFDIMKPATKSPSSMKLGTPKSNILPLTEIPSYIDMKGRYVNKIIEDIGKASGVASFSLVGASPLSEIISNNLFNLDKNRLDVKNNLDIKNELSLSNNNEIFQKIESNSNNSFNLIRPPSLDFKQNNKQESEQKSGQLQDIKLNYRQQNKIDMLSKTDIRGKGSTGSKLPTSIIRVPNFKETKVKKDKENPPLKIFRIYKKIKGRETLIGQDSSEDSAFKDLKKSLRKDLSASGYIEENGRRVNVSNVIDKEFRASKVSPSTLVERKGGKEGGSGRLSTFSERKAIQSERRNKTKNKNKRIGWL